MCVPIDPANFGIGTLERSRKTNAPRSRAARSANHRSESLFVFSLVIALIVLVDLYLPHLAEIEAGRPLMGRSVIQVNANLNLALSALVESDLRAVAWFQVLEMPDRIPSIGVARREPQAVDDVVGTVDDGEVAVVGNRLANKSRRGDQNHHDG